jgi:hypothetical protein
MIKFKLLIALAVVALSNSGAPAIAQTSPLSEPSLTTPPAPPPRYARRRIVIGPPPLLYRRCVDWYELQHRPSGTVLYPQMRCWWVRG